MADGQRGQRGNSSGDPLSGEAKAEVQGAKKACARERKK